MYDVQITTRRLTIQKAESSVADYVDERSGQDTDLDAYMKKLPIDVLKRVMADKAALLELADRLTEERGEDQLIASATAQSGEIIGYMSIANTKSLMQWFSISVVKNEQRKGYGYEMMCGFIEWLRENATGKELLYCVRPDNTASIALVKKVGGHFVEPKSFVENMLYLIMEKLKGEKLNTT